VRQQDLDHLPGYVMDVASADEMVSCSLMNEPPIMHGPRYMVTVTCSYPAGGAATSDAVVIATG